MIYPRSQRRDKGDAVPFPRRGAEQRSAFIPAHYFFIRTQSGEFKSVAACFIPPRIIVCAASRR